MRTSSMKILLIGSGGREHTIAWRLAQSPSVEKIYVIPGNGGTAGASEKIVNVTDTPAEDYDALVLLAQELQVDLVVPGPDDYVVGGIEGYFRKANIPCFAPTAKSAQLEGSKAFAKDFMQRHNIPTARYKNFQSTEYELACEYIRSADHSVVVKASGLAAGKGVIVAESKEEALAAVKEIMLDRAFGSSGDEVVIEEYLEGFEISILSLADGTNFVSLPPAQDHKRIFEGDKGPNTGGMGTYAPVDLVSKDMLRTIDETILEPTFRALREEADPFVGCLFTGFMITRTGPKVLEYNCRFGDPETQSLLPLLDDDTDLAQVMLACTKGDLPSAKIGIRPGYSASIILASGGYPGSVKKGVTITISEDSAKNTTIFHAGTKLSSEGLVTSGGRVLAVQALGDTLRAALDKAYARVKTISWDGMQYRKDIAHRALAQK